MKKYDVIIIGAGASGLMAASAALKTGKSVAILESGDKPARKVLASGGGRCNFTNAAVSVKRYFGNNVNFVRSAIAKVPFTDILNWAQDHDISWEEKTEGQYFCATGAASVVDALLFDVKNADMYLSTTVVKVLKINDVFKILTNGEEFLSKSVIVATGGVSFPALGVSDIGYKIAKQFGHKIIPVRPALCAISTNYFPSCLSGISIKVQISLNKESIEDFMLFTHFGLGGPAIYRATVRDFNDIIINMTPNVNLYEIFKGAKTKNGKKSTYGILSEFLPNRLAKWLCPETKNIADYKDKALLELSNRVTKVTISNRDIKLHGLQSAEVVRGGIDTTKISSKTMESQLCPGLFFTGEVLDIAGDLGGFNLHWAWASGKIAGENA